MKSVLTKYYKKYQEIPVAARAALWFVVCTMLQKCISFITVPIFTRIMPTEEYGIYSTYLSWYSILTVCCTLNMHNCIYINNVTKASSEKEKDEIAISLLSLTTLITLIVGIVFLGARRYFESLIALPSLIIVFMFVQIFFQTSFNFWSIKQRYEYQYIKLVRATIGIVIFNAILGIIAVKLVTTGHATARVFSIMLVQAVAGVYFYLYFFKRAGKVLSVKGWRHALDVQLPLLPHGLSLVILTSSDRIMINSLVGATTAAIYSVAYSAGYVVNILKQSIADSLSPWIYSKIKEKDYQAIRETTKPIMIFVMLIAFSFSAFAPEVIAIMAPKQYQEAIYVIPPVAASSFFTFLYNMFSIIGFYYERTKRIMIASVSGALLNIILNAICMPIFGYIAAGYTTLVCYMFFSVAHYFIMRSVCKKELNGLQLFDIRFIVLLASAVLIITILFAFIYKYIIIRYGIIAGTLLFVFIKRDYFIEILKTIKRK